MSIHNICFYVEIRKLSQKYHLILLLNKSSEIYHKNPTFIKKKKKIKEYNEVMRASEEKSIGFSGCKKYSFMCFLLVLLCFIIQEETILASIICCLICGLQ